VVPPYRLANRRRNPPLTVEEEGVREKEKTEREERVSWEKEKA